MRMLAHFAAIAVLVVLTSCSFIFNDYMKFVSTEVEVVAKLILPDSKGRSSDAVINYKRVSDGITFDRNVSVGTYVSSNPGDRYAINVREMDVRQTTWDNARFFFGPIVLLSITGTYFIMFLLGLVPGMYKRNDEQA